MPRASPHELSQVISGALYRVLAFAHREFVKRFTEQGRGTEFQVSGLALAAAAGVLRRFMFRALDYLPPGEVSFADFGRAIWAADAASNPKTPRYRKLLEQQLKRRAVLHESAQLASGSGGVVGRKLDVDLDALVDSDWLAYDFANRNRGLLRIPADVPFRVLPRLAVEKTTRKGQDVEARWRECIFKVSWEREEPDETSVDTPARRAVAVGTTLVVDRDTGEIRARLTTDASKAQERDRTRFLRRMVDAELLDPVGNGVAAGTLETDVTQGVLRVRGGARSLHLAGTGA